MRPHVLRTPLRLSLAIAMSLCFQGTGADKVEVTVDAAYTSATFLYLISGQELMYVSKASREEMMHFQIYQPVKLTKMDIEAAYSDPDISEQIVFYYGPKYGLKVEHTGRQRVKKIKYGTDVGQFPPKKGPNAAARKGDEIYFFKGKKVALASNFTTWKDAENVKTYKGMPSNIDAAWNDGDGMYLLKGNMIWRWNEDNTVDDAVLFNTTYHLSSWTLKP